MNVVQWFAEPLREPCALGEIVAGQEEGKKGEKATGGEKIAEFRYEAAQQSQRDGTGKDRPPAPTGHLIQQRDEKPIKENGL